MNLVLAWPAGASAAISAPLLVGYSGGLDSSVLLHRLAGDAALRARGLRAIHVHHGLHADADGWAAHCERTCARLGLALRVARVDVPRDGGEGLEAAARRARHAAFADTLGEGEVLVLAHHLDDQAETFLLRALRASGADGLGAMRDWRRFGRGWSWRPLLATPRAALNEYARAHDLRWIEDPSNDDIAHERNFLRHRIMPLLHERWPRAGDALARAAALQREAAALLEDEDARALAAVRGVDPAVVRASALSALPAARQARVLRRWLAALDLPPLPAEGVARIRRELLRGQRPGIAAFAWHGAVVRRWRDGLWAGRETAAHAPAAALPWEGREPLAWPGGGTLAFAPALPQEDARDADPGLAGRFLVHARSGGERIALPGRTHSHALKHVLQDLGVPPWLRARLPLLSDRDGRLLAAGDLVVSARLDHWLRATGRRLRWSGMDAA